MGSGACIGAIAEDGRSLRLIAPDAERAVRFNQEYEVGDVWELIATRPVADAKAPHTEDIIVDEKRYLGQARSLIASIEKHMPPQTGEIETLFDGLLQVTEFGSMFVAERSGVPGYSTLFWRPPAPLALDDSGVRIRYRYPTDDGDRVLSFTGYQDPIAEIPAGTLVRLSLARWWHPADGSGGEPRCYVQLSGWFLPGEIGGERKRSVAETAAEESVSEIDLDGLLESVFGYDRFRAQQREIVRSVLARQDTLVVMPTGGGKSLCYQLPAVAFDGLTVVVSPLISLMQDQVGQLCELGIEAVALNSDLGYSDYQQNMRRIKAGHVKLLYIAPETLKKPEILLLLDRSNVKCLAIDEAHCISEWGHDFRPEYRELAEVRARYPHAVCLALTATATPRVQRDIVNLLGLHEGARFVSSFDRENLFLEVRPKTDLLAQTLDYISRHAGQSGIIYCGTRRQVDELAADLVARGIPALGYHAGMEAEARRDNQRRFILEDGQIMVATVAFGMGIDKPNVRFVLHVDLPHDIENYYQQIGRAGRDGLPADCLLLYSPGDASLIRRQINQGSEEQRFRRETRLAQLIRWAEAGDCRRKRILEYFGEEEIPQSCRMCDNCLRREQGDEEGSDDLTYQARLLLECVKRTGERFGADHVIEILRGSRTQRLRKWGHERLAVYGRGAEYTVAEWKQLIAQFIRQDLLMRGNYQVLCLTKHGHAVLAGAEVRGSLPEGRVRAALRAGSRGRASEAGKSAGREARGEAGREAEYDRELFESLRKVRKRLAEEAEVPPYIIFSDRTLREMAAFKPRTLDEMAHVHGVGRHKLEHYGEEFLSIISAHAQ